MPKPSNLGAMSVDQLLKLRSDVEQVLTRQAAQLRDDLSKLSRQTVLRDGQWWKSAKRSQSSNQIQRRSGKYMGRTRSAAAMAAGEAESWSEAGRFCCQQIQET